MKICSIVTTYKPTSDLFERFESMLSVCEHIFIIDNTPGGTSISAPSDKYSIISDGENSGLGVALNEGIFKAKALDYVAAFLFDQDSNPTSEMARCLVESFLKLSVECQLNICIGPQHIDDQRFVLENGGKACNAKYTSAVSMVSCLPTSGMLISLRDISQQTKFSHDLFLDFVDFEWCWRIGRAGWRIFKINSAVLHHRLGLREDRLFGFVFSIPMPFRHYFLTRDALYLLFSSSPPLYDRVRMFVFMIVRLIYFSLFISPRFERFAWTMIGVKDYFKGVVGIGAAGRLLNKVHPNNPASQTSNHD